MEAARDLQIEKAVLTIAFIGPEKAGWKTRGVKDTEGVWWNTPLDIVQTLRPGQTYHVEYTVNAKGYRNIENIVPAAVAAPQSQRGKPVQEQNGNGNAQHYRPTHPRDGERMFVCSILNAFIQTGRIADDVGTLTVAVKNLRQVWADTFGQDDSAAG